MHRTSPVPRRSRPLLPSAVLLLALCLLAVGAQALTVPMDDAALATGADEVVRGEIADVHADWTADHAQIVTTARVTVKGRAKGQGADTLTLTSLGGTVGETTQWVEDQPVLVPGTEAFIFVKHGAKGNRVYGGPQGVVPVEQGRVHGNGQVKGGGVSADAYGHYIGALATGSAATPPASEPAPRAATAMVPVITNVSPSSASAGTGTEITITGTGFGSRPSRASKADVGFVYRYDWSAVTPIWASGYPYYGANEDDIVSWSDTRIVARVPAGTTADNYPGTASSGYVWVLTDGNAASAVHPFAVTFGYGGAQWGHSPVPFYINPDALSPALIAAIRNASASWNAAVPGTSFRFEFAGYTSSTFGGNRIFMGPPSDFGDALDYARAGIAGGSSTAGLDTCYLEFNPRYDWTGGAPGPGQVSIEHVALHELGHWLFLKDLYGWVPGYPSDAGKVMFGYGSDQFGNLGTTTLDPGDVAGIRWIYARGVPAPTPPTPPPTPVPLPYPGPHVVPARIEAEDYDSGGEGVAYHDTEPANLGGAYRPSEGVDVETGGGITDIGWVRRGEWLRYTVTSATRQPVVLRLRASCPDSTRGVSVTTGDGVRVPVNVERTGSFGTFALHNSTPFWLPAGETSIRLELPDRINIDYLEIVPAVLPTSTITKGPTSVPKPTPTTPAPTPTPSPALVISAPGRYALDHDIASDWIGVLVTSSDVVLDGMGHSIVGPELASSVGVLVTGTLDAPIANVTVRNLSVRHWGAGDWGEGICLAHVTGTSVEGVLAEENGNGLSHSEDSWTGVVRDSVFRNNTRAGIRLRAYSGAITVERCRITGNDMGIWTAYSSRFAGSPCLIADSVISGNPGDGVLVESSGIAVRNCTVSENGRDGLLLRQCAPEIRGNRIERNAGAGVDASDRAGSTITGNRIAGNAVGIVSGSGSPSAVWNNVLNNTDNGRFPNGAAPGMLNTTKAPGPNIVGGPFIGGNVWANPNGTGFSETHPDADGDGFCDVPFVTAQGAVDSLPLAMPPAVAAVPGGAGRPTSSAGNGVYDDINGNSRKDFADVVLYFNQMSWISANEPLAAFDYNGNGRIDFADVAWLFGHL